MDRFLKRRNRLRKRLRQLGVDAILVTNETNVTYLTGFTGDDSFLLVDQSTDLLLSDPRYDVQIQQQCVGLTSQMRLPSELLINVACQTMTKLGYSSVAIESNSVSVAMYDQLSSSLNATLVKTAGEVEELRVIKDAEEIRLLRHAVDVAERVFQSIRATMTASQTELDIAFEIERLIRQLGGSGCSFSPIVAAGARSALPHATPTQARIGESSLVLIDWGATFGGYRSDLTRVLLTSKIPAKIAKAYDAVLAAQTAAIAEMRPGVMVSHIDAIARDVIDSAGMGPRFNHGLGHGIGLEIHEGPRLGKNHDRPLEAGMVVTVGPGVYYPGTGGIRIEDDVLITQAGAEVLSSLPRDQASNRVELLT